MKAKMFLTSENRAMVLKVARLQHVDYCVAVAPSLKVCSGNRSAEKLVVINTIRSPVLSTCILDLTQN